MGGHVDLCVESQPLRADSNLSVGLGTLDSLLTLSSEHKCGKLSSEKTGWGPRGRIIKEESKHP